LAARSTTKSGVLRRRAHARRAPEDGPHARDELVHAEGLGDVVVRAGVEGGDLVGLALAHRQHDDRNVVPAAQARDHLEPVDSGQSEIEHDQIGVIARRQHQCGLPAARLVDLIAARLQVRGQRP
jgi:hypothetical protein